jgi:tRNA-uridine 2-sulfurtransferase
MNSRPTVVVAMSGGVDSSVAAALLVEQGYSVIGMMLRLWTDPGSEGLNRCCTPAAMSMAQSVARILSIPFYVLDARQVFYDQVVRPFIDDYTHNLTPNPCIPCNRQVRWGFLLDHALAAGADFLATGHYARLASGSNHTVQLLRGVDSFKDQSYVLHVLNQSQLKHALFPLGEFTKPEVRQLAQKYHLPVADRPDSQDLCFVGQGGDYRQFLARYAPVANLPGLIIDREDHKLGTHPGLAYFTIGQRKGLRIASPHPLYVIAKDASLNLLIVGDASQLAGSELIASGFNWIAGHPPSSPFKATVKIRYKAQDAESLVSIVDESRFRITFAEPVRNITPGQAVVIYNGDICLGGGIISG